VRSILTFFILLCISLFSCDTENESESNDSDSSNESPRIIKQSKLILPAKNAEFVLGEVIKFQVESKTAVDSVVVIQDDLSKTYFTDEFQWTSLTKKVGKQKIRVSVFIGDKKETHYPKFTILSDIVPVEYSYKIINTYPHNPESFTQGLFFHQDTLFESTGQNSESNLLKINLLTGEPYQAEALNRKYFGEGSTVWNNQIFYLTYTTQIGFRYDLGFNLIDEFRYPHQGWGITTMGDTLLVSDGSNIIRLIDPRDFSELSQLQVFDNERSYKELNELEYFNGKLFANVWFKDIILVIDPVSGKVIEKVDLSGILPSHNGSEDVLNGIAYNPLTNSLFVTGKLWPTLFEIELIKK
jgi:glutamine cyclotransferase